jgi:hypothetical protein
MNNSPYLKKEGVAPVIQRQGFQTPSAGQSVPTWTNKKPPKYEKGIEKSLNRNIEPIKV